MDNGKKSIINKYKIIEWLAIIVASISLTITMCQNNKIEELRYKDKALEYRPDLYSFNPPAIDSTISTFTKYEEFYNDKTDNNELILYYDLTVNGSITYKNIGNSKAIFRGFASHDFSNNKFQLKNIILDSTNVNFKFNDEVPQTILVGDSITIDFEHLITDFQSDLFTIHLMVYYQNESENYYYTYHWASYECPIITINKLFDAEFIKVPEKFYRKIFLIDSNCFSGIFSKDEQKKLNKRFSNHYEKQFDKKP